MAGRIAVVAKQILAAQTSTPATQAADLEDSFYDSCGALRQLQTPTETAKPEEGIYYDLTCENLISEVAKARKPSVDGEVVSQPDEVEDGYYYDSCGNLRQEMTASPEPTHHKLVAQSEEVEDGYYYDSCGNLRQELETATAPSVGIETKVDHGFYYDSCGNLRPDLTASNKPQEEHHEEVHAPETLESKEGFYYDSCGNMRQEMAADKPSADVAVIRNFAKSSFEHKEEIKNAEAPNGYYYDSCGNLRQEM
jgi:hypothetical protein